MSKDIEMHRYTHAFLYEGKKYIYVVQYVSPFLTTEERIELLDFFYSKHDTITFENLPCGGVLLRGYVKDIEGYDRK